MSICLLKGTNNDPKMAFGIYSLFARNDIHFGGTIYGGNAAGNATTGGIIQSQKYIDGVSGMKINLVNGSIYIA